MTDAEELLLYRELGTLEQLSRATDAVEHVIRANACVVDLYDRFKELREDRDKWKAKAEHLISRASHN